MDVAAKPRAVIGLHVVEQNGFAYDFFDLLGVRRDQVVDLSREQIKLSSDGEVWTANGLPHDVYTAHPDDMLRVRSWLIDSVSEIDGPEKMYISRRGKRKYLQEDELIAELKARGYAIIEDVPRSAVEQIQLFKSAKIIVGPHGAAFGNLLFSTQAALLEFQHPASVQPGFRCLCHQLGHRYQTIISKQGRLRSGPTQGYQHCDIDIPMEQVLSLLDTFEHDP